MLGIATAAAILIVAQSPAPSSQSERLPITLNGFAVEVLGNGVEGGAVDWELDAQTWHPCPPLLTDPGGSHPKSRYSITANGHRAEVFGWVDASGRFRWLYDDQSWLSTTRPTSRAPTAAMANGVIASKLDREGKVTASDHQTQAAVESLIESADAGRLKPPSLKKPSLFPAIPWGWIAAAILAAASLGFIGLAFILALWLILKRTRT